MNSRQKGIYTVEFAIIGAVFFMILFGVIEVARALFVWNTITEATRRGARVAAVCPPNDPAVKKVAVFGSADGTSTVLEGLTIGHVQLGYGAGDRVSVSIQGYTHNLIIPFLPDSVTHLTVPPFETTIPSESLGYIPGSAPGCPGA